MCQLRNGRKKKVEKSSKFDQSRFANVIVYVVVTRMSVDVSLYLYMSDD